MKDINGKIQYKGQTYNIVFNLNVMEEIQAEYGSVDVWGDLTDGVAYARRIYEKEGHKKSWDDLKAEEKAKYPIEPDAKAVIFGFCAMINEGIDIENDENGTQRQMLSLKQVGRLITEIGLAEATRQINDVVIASSKGEEKNE